MNLKETLVALGVPPKGETDVNMEACPPPPPCPSCQEGGQIPVGDWSGSKVLRHRNVEYLEPNLAAKEL